MRLKLNFWMKMLFFDRYAEINIRRNPGLGIVVIFA